MLGLWIADLLNIPVSGIYHTDIPSYAGRLTSDPGIEEMAWQLIRFFYSRMERVYVLSDSYRDKLTKRGVPAEKIRRFAKGIDIDFFRNNGTSSEFRKQRNLEDKIVLLYVGRVSKEKDLDVLHRSYRAIRDDYPNLALVIVGDGPYLKELKERMSDLNEVIFTGFIEGKELADIYCGSDIFVFPSTTDTYGTVLLEAQAAKLPAVVSDSGGPKEVILDGETGIVTKAKDAQSFAAALVKLITDEEARKAMGEKGFLHVSTRTWENAFKNFVDDHLVSDLIN
jgi:glycosyltransferase involved in cell wall biosynthesis